MNNPKYKVGQFLKFKNDKTHISRITHVDLLSGRYRLEIIKSDYKFEESGQVWDQPFYYLESDFEPITPDYNKYWAALNE